MDSLANSIDYHRAEVRVPCQDFEMMNFSLMGESDSQKFSMIVLNKSNNGLGVSCHDHPDLEIGKQLNLFDLIVYEIRWIHKLTDHVINIGLKVIKEIS